MCTDGVLVPVAAATDNQASKPEIPVPMTFTLSVTVANSNSDEQPVAHLQSKSTGTYWNASELERNETISYLLIDS